MGRVSTCIPTTAFDPPYYDDLNLLTKTDLGLPWYEFNTALKNGHLNYYQKSNIATLRK